MARKYYHAEGLSVVKDHHDGVGPVLKHICVCPSPEMAQKTAAKLNAADDFEYALGVIAEGRTASAEYAQRTLHEANAKEPNHY